MTRLSILLASLVLPHLGVAVEQNGAEQTKKPIAVEIGMRGAVPADKDTPGNVRVTYADGSKDWWTTKGNCSQAHVAPDGLVGWTVHEPPTKIAASYTVRPNPVLILFHHGKQTARIESAKAFIEEWAFVEKGRLVLKTRGAHGPAAIELHDTESGALLKSVVAYAPDLPPWAKPFADN